MAPRLPVLAMSFASTRIVLSVLAACIALTRPHHFGAVHHLPDATLAAFFLAGALAPSYLGFAALLAIAFGIDAIAMLERGGLLHCVTPAYAGLPIAYGILWQAGVVAQRSGAFTTPRLALLGGILAGSCALAFLITSGGYYLLSGQFPDPSWGGFANRIARYGLAYVWSPVPYVALTFFALQWPARLSRLRAERERS